MTEAERIETFLRSLDPHQTEWADDTSLFEARVLDSMHLAELMAFLETEFRISIQPHEVTPQNFDSLRALEAFVKRKKTP